MLEGWLLDAREGSQRCHVGFESTGTDLQEIMAEGEAVLPLGVFLEVHAVEATFIHASVSTNNLHQAINYILDNQ